MSSQIHTTYSAEETQAIAREFAKTVRPGETLALFGDLGSGKTTFTQGLAQGLGVTKHVQSPTFVLMREYDLPSLDNARLHHLDLYRLQSADDLHSVNLEEMVNQEKNLFVIEWADRIDPSQISDAVKINFEIISPNSRRITISRP